MIVEQHKLDVSVHGAGKTEEFKMKATAKSFAILMDGLYSNKIAAVIRELAANAADSHQLAGCPEKPFHIKMPNSIDPTFKIRDHGTGLSDDDMYNIYTTFFESTKEASNDFTGCLGLGSKSFFAVADSANINTYFNGIRTVYIAYLNENRIPSLSTFSSMPTEEENGIEIEVAIKKNEISYFRDEVNKQLKYFKVKPVITGDSHFQWNLDEEYVSEGTNWKLCGKGAYDKIRAVQGQIAYPIQVHNMGARADDASPALKALLNTNLLLTFEIGEININPSRETLSYDDATVDNIFKKAAVVLEELPSHIAEKLNSIETEWEARLFYRDICNSLGGNGTQLLNKIEESGLIKWNDTDITSLHIKVPVECIDEYRLFYKNREKFKKDTKQKSRTYYGKENVFFWDFTVQKGKTIVYTDGNDKSVDARAKQYANDNNISTITILEVDGKIDRYDELNDALGNPGMIRASELEKVRRVKSTGPKEIQIKVPCFSASGWTKTDNWENIIEVEDLMKLEGLYVNLDRINVQHDGRTIFKFSDLVKLCEKFGFLGDMEIYGLRTRNQKADHELEYFFDFIERKLKEENITAYEFSGLPFNDHLSNDNSFRMKILDEMPKSSDLYKITHAVNSNIKNNLSSSQLNLFRNVGLSIPGKDMNTIVEKCKVKYPMIKGARYSVIDSEIIDYAIKMDMFEKMEKDSK